VRRVIAVWVLLAACGGTARERDASVVGLAPPAPRRPAHGAFVPLGAVPRFAWDAVPSATRYQLQLDDGCTEAPLDCDPVKPDVEVEVTAPTWDGATLGAGRWTWRVRACDAAGACSPWTRPRRVDVGRAPNDVDGDGRSDVIAGAPLLDGKTADVGAALIVFGGAGDARGARTARLDSPGGHADAELGAAVAIVGDIDGDGHADVVVGAPGTDEERGRAYLYLGAPGGVRGPVLTIQDPAGKPGDWFGAAVIGAGDLDGDGFADVAIGAPGADGDGADQLDRGKVMVWRGGRAPLARAPITLAAGAPRPHDGFGSTLGAGDLDGDGYGEVVVGAAGIDRAGAEVGVDRGAVYVFSGGRDGLARWPSARLEAPTPTDFDRFGFAVSASGDLDGDGLDDLAVGAPSRDDAATDGGVIYVFPGARHGVSITPTRVIGAAPSEAFRRLGTAVAIVGDVDGDTRDDLCAGTSGTGGGLAVIFSGADLDAVLATLRDPTGGPTDFGDSVAGAGDVDGDGHADVVVGAATPSRGATAGGSVLVFPAITAASPPPPIRIDGPAQPAQLGRSVSGR